jgi:predicted ATP-dependent serine protease
MSGAGTASGAYNLKASDLMLYRRDAERSKITELLESARAATGGVLVLRGPPGVGKSALLNEAIAHATGMRVLRTTGVESEFELPFVALHQLLRPVLSRLDRLPEPQAQALARGIGSEREQPRQSLLGVRRPPGNARRVSYRIACAPRRRRRAMAR